MLPDSSNLSFTKTYSLHLTWSECLDSLVCLPTFPPQIPSHALQLLLTFLCRRWQYLPWGHESKSAVFHASCLWLCPISHTHSWYALNALFWPAYSQNIQDCTCVVLALIQVVGSWALLAETAAKQSSIHRRHERDTQDAHRHHLVGTRFFFFLR